MRTGRLDAFSDGVLAIIITIMVLELERPDGTALDALWATTGVGFLAYVLSFVYVGIYWNSHHHLFQLVDRVSGSVLWANLHLVVAVAVHDRLDGRERRIERYLANDIERNAEGGSSRTPPSESLDRRW